MKLTAFVRSAPVVLTADGSWQLAEGDELQVEAEATNPAEATLAGARISPSSVVRRGSFCVTRWAIPIHTWAGRSELEVDDGLEKKTALLDVAPHPGKLGLDAFREMLDELAAINRNMPWGLSPGALAAERATDSPALLHPAVLDHELPPLLAALRMLRHESLMFTSRARHVASMRSTREVDARSVRWLLRHPRALVATQFPTAATHDQDSVGIDQRRTVTTRQHPATAHLRFLIERLVRRLTRAHNSLVDLARKAQAEDREHAASLAARTARARDLLAHELLLDPLYLVEPKPAAEGAAQAVVDHPLYARVQRAARRLLDPGMTISDRGAFRAPARRTHELYELLVTYRLIVALKEHVGSAWVWTSPAIERLGAIDGLESDACFVARGPGDFRLEVRVQSSFAAYNPDASKNHRRSLSKTRRPDVVVGLFDNDRLRRWIIVDPKYRSARPAIHDGLADIHVYRDSLRWAGQRARACFIAVPACASDAMSYAAPEYLDAHRFGAIITKHPDAFAPVLRSLRLQRAGDVTLRNSEPSGGALR